MRVSAFQVLTAIAFCALIGASVWLVFIVFRKDNYTRERFAFASLTAFSGMVASALAAMADNHTLAGELSSFARGLFGMGAQPEPPRVADHLLMILVLVIVSHFLLRIYDNWTGAVSMRQYDKERYHEPAPLVAEGLHEAKRILKRQPAPRVMDRMQHKPSYSALEPSRLSLAWHLEARDLICLRSASYEIDRSDGWHDQAHCWIGRNRKTGGLVAVKCTEQQPTPEGLLDFTAYVMRLSEGAPPGTVEFILATRAAAALKTITLANRVSIRAVDAQSLIDGLVDFSDYFAHIRDRVERFPLPDSDQTLSQVYVSPRCRHEAGSEVDFESYIDSWLVEPGQRQLALLGEYGQGKSTAAVMLAHRLISRGTISRVPVLIELRGKSPRNMTPEEIIAGWSYPYNINPQAVMKLVTSGKILLILEGFDEMALVGDSEARFSHFETLWKFCFPSSKIIISGRPNFFLDDEEMRAALGISRATAAGPYCEALRLNPFTIEQIASALRASPEETRCEIVDLATKDLKFREIVSRGSLLYVVSQLWQREELSRYVGRITSAFVIELFIKHSFRRQSQKTLGTPEFMVLTESERKYFTLGIAAYMGALDLPNQITREQFERLIKNLYEAIPASVSAATDGLPRKAGRPLHERLKDAEDPSQDVANDVRSAGILVLDESKAGALRFAHKSFMEYLIARAYANYLCKQDLEASATAMTLTGLKARNMKGHHESTSFLAEILISFIGGREGQEYSGGGARALYDIIVVGPMGAGVTARIRGWLAVRALVVDARRSSSKARKGATWQGRSIYLKLGLLAATGLCTVGVFVVWEASSWTMLGLATVASLTATLPRLPSADPDAVSSMRLWFLCCIAAGMLEFEIAFFASPADVREIVTYLRVETLVSDPPGRTLASSASQ